MHVTSYSLGPLCASRVRPPARDAHGWWPPAPLTAQPRWDRLPLRAALGILLAVVMAPHTAAQGPMPEEGATLFPHGAFLSYNSLLTSYRRAAGAPEGPSLSQQPTLVHEMPLALSWSPRRDLQLTATVPFVRKTLDLPGGGHSAAGLGDAMVGLKYRFLRHDSSRGTTQASFEVAPKLPTGSVSREDSQGRRLAPALQPGTGSLDWCLTLTTTYTGLFGIRKLVADAAVTHMLRTENSQRQDLGDSTDARLWVHFRPLQTELVGGEWFIGPDIQWRKLQPMRAAGATVEQTGLDLLSAGITTYISPRAGLTFWASALFPIHQNWNGAPYEQRARLSFGLTKQFVLGR